MNGLYIAKYNIVDFYNLFVLYKILVLIQLYDFQNIFKLSYFKYWYLWYFIQELFKPQITLCKPY